MEIEVERQRDGDFLEIFRYNLVRVSALYQVPPHVGKVCQSRRSCQGQLGRWGDNNSSTLEVLARSGSFV